MFQPMIIDENDEVEIQKKVVNRQKITSYKFVATTIFEISEELI